MLNQFILPYYCPFCKRVRRGLRGRICFFLVKLSQRMVLAQLEQGTAPARKQAGAGYRKNGMLWEHQPGCTLGVLIRDAIVTGKEIDLPGLRKEITRDRQLSAVCDGWL